MNRRCRVSVPSRSYALALCLLPLVVLLSGCAIGSSNQPNGGASTHPTSPPSLTSAQLNAGPLLPAPLQGWRRILGDALVTTQPGLAGVGGSGEVGVVASGARPGRVVGCLIPTTLSTVPATPTFVLSDDAGFTWQILQIPHVQQATACTVVADTVQSDTFIVNTANIPTLGNNDQYSTYITWDAGKTWHKLPPSGKSSPYVLSLTNGVALAYLSNSTLPSVAPKGLSEATLTSTSANDSWRTVYQNIPGLHDPTNSFETVAMDPGDPSHLYVAMSTGAFGVTVYATSDAGASWRSVLRVSTAINVLLWTANNHQVFMEVFRGQDAPYQLYYSANDAATWRGIATHYRDGGESIYSSPSGRLVSMTVQSASVQQSPTGSGTDMENFFTLDPRTGAYTLLGTYPFGKGAQLGVVVDGPTPTFIYGNDMRSLPPQ